MFAPEAGGPVLPARVTRHGDERATEGEQHLTGRAGRLTGARQRPHVARAVHLLQMNFSVQKTQTEELDFIYGIIFGIYL